MRRRQRKWWRLSRSIRKRFGVVRRILGCTKGLGRAILGPALLVDDTTLRLAVTIKAVHRFAIGIQFGCVSANMTLS